MKTSARVLLLLSVVLFLAALANAAQCPEPDNPNAACVLSFTISPGAITGDGVETGTGYVTAYLPNGITRWYLLLNPMGLIPQGCPGFLDVGYVCYVTGATVTVSFTGINNQQAPILGQMNVSAQYNNDPGMTASITVNPVPAPPTPANNPDGRCPTGGAAGANPINFANGDTWITQQDYAIPGLGGGLVLARTWNSVWPLMQPPEQSGIFGDSWRSNFEERIQTLTGGVVQYWKGDGCRLFYLYNSMSGTYSLTAPADDQTALSFNSGTAQWTIIQKDGTSRIFNSGGYLTSIVDRNSNTTTISIDANNQNRIASVTDASGHVLTFNYANASYPRLCTSISDAVGTFTTYNYDFTTARLTQVQYPDNSQFNFQYNDPYSTTLISLVTDAMSKTIEAHTYDSQRRGITSQQANDSSGHPVNLVTVTYATSAPWQTAVQNSFGHTGTLSFGTVAQRTYLFEATGSSCATCGYLAGMQTYRSPSGYPVTSLDANFNVAYFAYDSQGNMTSKSLPEASGAYDTWNYTYNSFGEVLTATDPLGQPGDPNHTTTNHYDTHGNLLNTITPSPDGVLPGSTTTFTYNTNGTLKTIKDPLNNLTTISYFTSGANTGLINTIKDANNKVTTYAYDGRGNRTSIIDPVNGSTKPTTFGYDSMNRLNSITYPGATTNVQIHHDYRGRRDYVIDQNGFKTIYGYDDADRLTSVTDAQSPSAGVTTYAYDTENNLTDIYDAAQNHTHFDYINDHNVQKVTFPSGYYEQYTWDGNDNLTSKVDRKNQQITFHIDPQNRVGYRLDPGNTVYFTYDPAGRMTNVNDDTGTYTFSYDNMNRLTQATTDYSFDSAGALTVKYGYDAASNRTSMTDPQNLSTAYTYDVLDRLKTLAFNGQTPAFGFGYDALSRRNSLTRPNGVNTTYTYDPASSLLSVLHKLGTTTIDGASYTYDNAENRKTRTDKRLNTTLTYGYDNIYQLQSAKQGATSKESYSNDIVGNRLTSQIGSQAVTTYMPNTSNELMSTTNPTVSYTYDNNGSVLTKSDGTQYTWDYENQLTQVVLPGTGGTVNFKYDPFGRRIQKSFTQSGTTTTTDYLYDGVNRFEDVDVNGNLLARYVQGNGIDKPLEEIASGTTSYYQQDGLGSVTSLSSTSGTIGNNTYTYDSYGNTTTSATVANPFRYTGREFDTEAAMYYYRARYYDQNVGRFLSEDPIGFDGTGFNFYTYVANNPTKLIDPLGLLPRGSDRWWGYNNRDFQRWFHRCWKERGDPDAGRKGIEEAYAEWVNRGSPTGGDCWGNDKKKRCEDPQKAKSENQQWWDDFWQTFWDGVHQDQWDIEYWLRHLPDNPQPGYPPPPPMPIPIPVP
jgi:RHS repeat-associated protein